MKTRALILVLALCGAVPAFAQDTSAACGGIAGATCADGQYCDFPDNSCGKGDMQGSCQAKPEACMQLYRPVCGCDGRTYGNDCTARSAGTDVMHEGTCEDGAGGKPLDADKHGKHDKAPHKDANKPDLDAADKVDTQAAHDD